MRPGSIAFDYSVPTMWPPESDFLVYSGYLYETKIHVIACRDARLRFHCDQDSESCEFTSSELDMPNYAHLTIAFSWGGESQLLVGINGTTITEETRDPGRRISLNSKDRVATGLREKLIFRIPSGLSIEEERLIRSVAELQDRIACADRVNLLEASAILRRLLLDARPLVHLVNRVYRCKLLFPVVQERTESKILLSANIAPLSSAPQFAPAGQLVQLPLEAFLAQAVVRRENFICSVRDVIDVCANTKGGIHFDEPRTDVAQQILALDQQSQPAFIDASLYALADFSWSVIHGLRPLIAEIEARHS